MLALPTASSGERKTHPSALSRERPWRGNDALHVYLFFFFSNCDGALPGLGALRK